VTTPASNITVLVVDDQRLVRAGFQVILDLEPDITVVGEAGDGYEAITLAARLSPTVVLMDVRMPGMDGLAAARAIVAGTSSRVLMLTTFDSDEYVYTALRAGASGFLLKDTPSQHLVTAVRSVAAGDALIDPTITRRLIQQFVRATRPSTTAPEQLAALTPREREVLRHIAQGLSNRRGKYRQDPCRPHPHQARTPRPRPSRRPRLRDRIRRPRPAAIVIGAWSQRDSGLSRLQYQLRGWSSSAPRTRVRGVSMARGGALSGLVDRAGRTLLAFILHLPPSAVPLVSDVRFRRSAQRLARLT